MQNPGAPSKTKTNKKVVYLGIHTHTHMHTVKYVHKYRLTSEYILLACMCGMLGKKKMCEGRKSMYQRVDKRESRQAKRWGLANYDP